jgi:predicted nucleic acid-binding Zn ribbon protein
MFEEDKKKKSQKRREIISKSRKRIIQSKVLFDIKNVKVI